MATQYEQVLEAVRALSPEERARLRDELAREAWAARFLAACDAAAGEPELSAAALAHELQERRGERW